MHNFRVTGLWLHHELQTRLFGLSVTLCLVRKDDAYPPDIRKVLYTTNPMESVNRSLRKVSKNRGVFPSDNAVKKLFYLPYRNISQKWTRPIANWTGALNRFFILFGDRVPSF